MKVIAKDKIKDVLVTRTAIKCLISDHIVEKIIDFQGKDASLAVKTHNEVEFAGFGKFMVSKPKLKRKIDSLKEGIEIVIDQIEEDVPDARKEYLKAKLKGMQERLVFLINKTR